jgi:hypothetical protein
MKFIEKHGANDEKDTRLGEIHEQLAQIGASSAEIGIIIKESIIYLQPLQII